MKNLYLSGLILVSFVFVNCETKLTDFSVKKTIDEHYTFLDPDGFVDTSYSFNGVLRSQLDISENAEIKSIKLEGADINLKGLPGHVTKKYKVQALFSESTVAPSKEFFRLEEDIIISPEGITTAIGLYFIKEGVDEINKFMRDNLILNKQSIGKFFLRLTPIDGKSNIINTQINLNMTFTIEYTDCFATGNLGNDECK